MKRKIHLFLFLVLDSSVVQYNMIKNIKCTICNRYYSKMGMLGHVWRQHTKKGRQHQPTKGQSSWNKNLTKETDDRVKKIGETLKYKYKTGQIRTTKGLHLSETHKKKLSDIVRRKIKEGTWHNSFSKSRTHKYKGLSFYGKWELNFAKFLDKLNITWKKPANSFEYEFEEQKRHYTPDFYLPNENLYIEIKGYKTLKDEAKWKWFTKKLLVLDGKDLYELRIIENYKTI